MAKKYKLLENGVQDVENHRSIPNSMDNRHWVQYQEWLADGNTPDPEFTQEEIDQNAIRDEITGLTQDLKRALKWQFRMIQEMFEAGVQAGTWDSGDFSPEVVAKAQEWKTKLQRLAELGE